MNSNFVITIGRQLGSGGILIGKRLAEKLGIAFYDKELIIIASKESGLCKEFFEQADEKKSFNFFSNLFGLKTSLHIDEWYSNAFLSNDTLFKIQSDIIRDIAEKQSCVFVGRCADYILRDNPKCVSIFLTANIDDRIEFISNQEKLSFDKAKEFIEKTDKKRAGYYSYYTHKIWGQASSYDLCINSSVLGIDETTDYVYKFAVRKLGL